MAYEVALPADAEIVLDKDGPEQEYAWLDPETAAKHLLRKFPQDFCDLIGTL
jgi:putative SOS response-associated peptidase YedK